MFDIGFPELLLISIVALLVIGPNELPNAIRSLSLWIGRIRRSFTKIRQEIENEIGADEIRAQLHNEQIMEEIEASKASIQETKEDINNMIGEVKSDLPDPTTESEEHVDTKQSN
ncbi:MAG TPA: twin-arginine translocase subunit TatB [Gammaproteobacteria bacterium]|nr:twin-arginine translocase subunit TatB [Gammaproteobacteria bacterium]|tara:strand:+ start:4673 stop:5017 length:345 start_codon:yes stop_codon:yes gene_type:complete